MCYIAIETSPALRQGVSGFVTGQYKSGLSANVCRLPHLLQRLLRNPADLADIQTIHGPDVVFIFHSRSRQSAAVTVP